MTDKVKKVTKATVVRSLIAKAKSRGAEMFDARLITAVETATGFGRQLARNYIKCNWEKVVKPGEDAKKEAKRLRDNERKRAQRAAAKAAKEVSAPKVADKLIEEAALA